jgi:hypothetical protein
MMDYLFMGLVVLYIVLFYIVIPHMEKTFLKKEVPKD